MHVRTGEAFAGTEQLTVLGKQLHAGDAAPDYRLEYLDLADLATRTILLADTVGIVRRLGRGEQPGTPGLPTSGATVGVQNGLHQFTSWRVS